MRAPDYEAELHENAASMAYASIAEGAVNILAEKMGIPREKVDVAQQESRKKFESLGRTVRAWKLPSPDEGGAQVVTWIINGPFNMMWQWWLLTIVHLRELPGEPPADIRREGASHEVMIMSLNPDAEPDIDKLDRGLPEGLPGYLTPPDLAWQVVGLTDEQAEELGGLMIDEILVGRMSPDGDFKTRWQTLLDNTVEHMRYGTHPSRN